MLKLCIIVSDLVSLNKLAIGSALCRLSCLVCVCCVCVRESVCASCVRACMPLIAAGLATLSIGMARVTRLTSVTTLTPHHLDLTDGVPHFFFLAMA